MDSHREKWKIPELAITSKFNTYLLGPPWPGPRKEVVPRNPVVPKQCTQMISKQDGKLSFILFLSMLLPSMLSELNIRSYYSYSFQSAFPLVTSYNKLGPSLCNNYMASFSGNVRVLQGQGFPGAPGPTGQQDLVPCAPCQHLPVRLLPSPQCYTGMVSGTLPSICPRAPHLTLLLSHFLHNTACDLILCS